MPRPTFLLDPSTGQAVQYRTAGGEATRAAESFVVDLDAGTVDLNWLEDGVAKVETFVHGGGDYPLPLGRAYTWIRVTVGAETAEVWRPGQEHLGTFSRPSQATYWRPARG